MLSIEKLKELLPLAAEWAEHQEKIILENGVALNEEQQIDAYLIGVKDIQKVRLLKVDQVPFPTQPALKAAAEEVGLISPYTLGTSFRYGIYINSRGWNDRSLVAHELTHTMQYERIGGFEQFLSQYLYKCLTDGYSFSSLEREAIEMAEKVCGGR